MLTRFGRLFHKQSLYIEQSLFMSFIALGLVFAASTLYLTVPVFSTFFEVR